MRRRRRDPLVNGEDAPAMPAAPLPFTPSMWTSVDPAGNGSSKPSVACVWRGVEAVSFTIVWSRRDGWWHNLGEPLVVAVESGFVGKGKTASLMLERERGKFEMFAQIVGAEHCDVHPSAWKAVVGIPNANPDRPMAMLCERLVRQLPGGTMPRVPLAAKASNKDKRAALLIGLACVNAWGWR